MFDALAPALDAPDACLSPLEEQIRLEEEMIDGGIQRVLKFAALAEKNGVAADAAAARYLTGRLIAPMEAAVEGFIQDAVSGKAGRSHSGAPKVAQAGPAVAAFITLRTLLNCLTADTDAFTTVARMVGRNIEDELWMRNFKKANKDLFRVTVAEAQNHLDPKLQHAIARKFARQQAVPGEWSEQDRIVVGTKMIELAKASTGLVEIGNRKGRKGGVEYTLRISDQATERLAEISRLAGAMSPTLLPAMIPPKPWLDPFSGGYHSGLFRNLFLVKTRHRGHLEDMANRDLSAVLASVNAVQATPWRVNTRVLEVLAEALDTERAIAGLPERVPEVPPYPPAADHDPLLKTAWKRAAAKAHDAARKNLSKRLTIHQAVSLAKRFAGRDIYFPHNMDFRGRLYPLPATLHPQGPDHVKALLTFARGYPIEDERAAGWLAISAANHYGVDKVSLEERIGWVQQHEEAILATAEDPWGPALDFWSKADKPWQFLAVAFEWAEFKRFGYGYVSSLPVALDGSCNGLQHYSAALRDPVGGAAVNLIPGDRPRDIYATVAERAVTLTEGFVRPDTPDYGSFPWLPKYQEIWTKRSIDPHRMARRWLTFGIDRKITKRSVMTLPYGSTTFSCRDFLEEALREKLGKGAKNPFTTAADQTAQGRDYFDASLFLQPIVWQAIGETVQAARVAMDWLKATAQIVAKQDLPIVWRTADGFVVQQAYRKTKSIQINTILDGRRFAPRVALDTLEVDARAQTQGVAPNWVHSQDATALRMFVNLALANGLEDFALVHDSYGAPAAKVDIMAACLKEAFVMLYTEHDPITDFHLDMIDQLSDEKAIEALPEPPERGDLDLSLIRQSDYFFA